MRNCGTMTVNIQWRDHSFIWYVCKNFPKNKHFLPPDTHMYVYVSGCKKCWFFGKFWERTKWMIPKQILKLSGIFLYPLRFSEIIEENIHSGILFSVKLEIYSLEFGQTVSDGFLICFSRYQLKQALWDHSFSTYAKFSEKLIFLAPWYAHVPLHIRRQENASFAENFEYVLNEWLL